MSVPLAWIAGGPAPSWLPGAWQVSAVLVAFDLALIVFLLQLAASHSIRADPSFRALIDASHVVWPIAFSLVFIGWAGVLEFSNGAHATSVSDFLDAWALGYFLVQLVMVFGVFVGTFRIVSPDGVGRVIGRRHADLVRRTVVRRLVDRRANEIVVTAVRGAKLARGPLFSFPGFAVHAQREGTIADVNTKLPARLAKLPRDGELRLNLPIGVGIPRTYALVVASSESDAQLASHVRKAIYIRPGGRADEDWRAILGESLDLIRQALADGTRWDGAVGVLLSGLRELPRAYGRYGLRYEPGTVREMFGFGAEDLFVNDLAQVSREVFASGAPGAVARLPELGYRIVSAGIEENASLLMRYGHQLWLAQVGSARRLIRDEELRAAVTDSVGYASREVLMILSASLEDASLDAQIRSDAGSQLQDAFGFEIDLMRLHIDAQDIPSFRAAWDRLQEWGQYWSPELDPAPIAQELAARLAEAREWGFFNLGAWLLRGYRRGDLTQQTWEDINPYLLGVFGSIENLTAKVVEMDLGSDRISRLNQWDLSRTDLRTTVRVEAPVSEDALRWTALLLLRRTDPAGQPTLEFGEPIEYVAEQLRARVNEFTAASNRWEVFVDGRLIERANALRAGIDSAVAAEKQRLETRVATAALDPERCAKYVDVEQTAFVQFNGLRRTLTEADALVAQETEDATRALKGGITEDKRPFIAESPFNVLTPAGIGHWMAVQEQQAVFEALAKAAPPASSNADTATTVVAAVRALVSKNLRPVVLVPTDPDTRRQLAQHREWSPPNSDPRTRGSEIGALHEAPVINVGTAEPRSVIIVDLKSSLRLIERRPPGATSPLQLEVRTISEDRAREIVEQSSSPASTELAQAARGMSRLQVEVFVGLDHSVQVLSTVTESAINVALPEIAGP